MSSVINVRLKTKFRDKINELSKKYDVTKSEIIRNAIIEYIENLEER